MIRGLMLVGISLCAVFISTGDALAGPYDEAVSASNPVSYWRFEEAPGAAQTTNQVAGGPNGLYNGITLGQASAFPNLGNAARFEPDTIANPGTSNIDFGLGQDVSPTANPLSWLTNRGPAPQSPKATSLEFWMQTSQTSTNNDNWRSPVVFGVESPGQGDIFWGWMSNGGLVGVSGGIGFSSSDNRELNSTVAINDNAWHHVVISFDWDTAVSNMYIDGVLHGSATGTPNDNARNRQDDDALIRYMGWNHIVDGAQTGSNTSPNQLSQFEGLLDEVAIYDRVISGQEVGMHFLAASGVTSPADFNRDTNVDMLDFAILRDNLNTGTIQEEGDANLDGKVTLADFRVWKSEFNAGAAAAVPEPASIGLLIAGMFAAAGLARAGRF